MDKKEKKGKIMIHELKELSQKEVMLMVKDMVIINYGMMTENPKKKKPTKMVFYMDLLKNTTVVDNS